MRGVFYLLGGNGSLVTNFICKKCDNLSKNNVKNVKKMWKKSLKECKKCDILILKVIIWD